MADEDATDRPLTARVRPAVRADREAVWPLAVDLAANGPPTRESFDATFYEVLDSPAALLLVAEDDDGVCGYLLAHVHVTFHASGPVVWGEELVVERSRRGRGVGRALMRALEVWAGEREARYIALATRRAGGFYLALGYDESAMYYKKPLPYHFQR